MRVEKVQLIKVAQFLFAGFVVSLNFGFASFAGSISIVSYLADVLNLDVFSISFLLTYGSLFVAMFFLLIRGFVPSVRVPRVSRLDLGGLLILLFFIACVYFWLRYAPYRDLTGINDGPFHKEILNSIWSHGEVKIRPAGIRGNGTIWEMDGLYPISTHLQVAELSKLFSIDIAVTYNRLSSLYAYIWFPSSTALAALYLGNWQLKSGLAGMLLGLIGAPNLEHMQLPGIAVTPVSILVAFALTARFGFIHKAAIAVLSFFVISLIHPSGLAIALVIYHVACGKKLILRYLVFLTIVVFAQSFTAKITSTIGYMDVWVNGNVTDTQGFTSETDVIRRGIGFLVYYVLGLGGGVSFGFLAVPAIIGLTLYRQKFSPADRANTFFAFLLLLSTSVTGLELIGSKFGYLTLFWYGDPKRVVLVWTAVLVGVIGRTIGGRTPELDSNYQLRQSGS